jgi:putative membrane protein
MATGLHGSDSARQWSTVRILADALLLMVALIHAYIVVLEMVLWTTPRGRAAFGTTAEFAQESKVLAANQGLYNGFLVAGLLVAVVAPDRTGYWFAIFFTCCVIIAGLYGGLTVSRRILLVQSVPAALALTAVVAAG